MHIKKIFSLVIIFAYIVLAFGSVSFAKDEAKSEEVNPVIGADLAPTGCLLLGREQTCPRHGWNFASIARSGHVRVLSAKWRLSTEQPLFHGRALLEGD